MSAANRGAARIRGIVTLQSSDDKLPVSLGSQADRLGHLRHDILAMDLAGAYHQRWEQESAFDEIKTDLRGRGDPALEDPGPRGLWTTKSS
jgi:hypothetical protein